MELQSVLRTMPGPELREHLHLFCQVCPMDVQPHLKMWNFEGRKTCNTTLFYFPRQRLSSFYSPARLILSGLLTLSRIHMNV